MKSVLFATLVFLAATADASQAQDARELVRLPEPMQEHMLGNMRDHLATLNEIIGDVADGKFDEAAKLSEQRLGMSSLGLHGAAHMAPFMPKPMQDIGTSMHRAASRLGDRPAGHLGVADVRYDARCQPGPSWSHDNLRGVPRELSNPLRW